MKYDGKKKCDKGPKIGKTSGGKGVAHGSFEKPAGGAGTMKTPSKTSGSMKGKPA